MAHRQDLVRGHRNRSAGIALVGAIALLATACGGDDGGGDDAAEAGFDIAATDTTGGWFANATEYRDMVGEQVAFVCDEDGDVGSVWGTDVYSDDSSVCTAAVHAGVIDEGEGATVVIEILPGEDDYSGSDRNGIESFDWTVPWPGSFRVLGTD